MTTTEHARTCQCPDCHDRKIVNESRIVVGSILLCIAILIGAVVWCYATGRVPH